jgi:hypothetical protein
MNESEVGGNGQFDANSSHYSTMPFVDDGGSSLGESAVGNSSSASYQTNSGFNTTAQPGLMLNISTSAVNLGVLSTAAASTGTASFSVRDYTSSGYNVFMFGSAPTYSGHSLAALTTDTSWSSNTEMFGVNLVSNGTVAGSANPSCQATGYCYSSQAAGDGTTGTYGSTRPYTIANSFRFPFPATSGEIVAHAPQSSGETDYVVSLMAGISTLTPGGSYQGSITLVATGSY